MTKSKLYSGNVIDFEASGFGAESYPIEVGVVLESGKAYHSLIKPCSHWTHWTQEAQNTHRISRSELERDGKSIYEVCQDLNNLCGQSRLFSDCWVLDSQWMNTLFYSANIAPSFTLSPIDYFVTEDDLAGWAKQKRVVARREGIKLHRALHDAYVIKTILDAKVSAVPVGVTSNRPHLQQLLSVAS